MPSIEDVAKLAGVSTATVSAVVNGQEIVKPRTKKRILEAIRTLKYEPNFYARTLARGRSNIIGIIVSDILNPFFAEIAQIVQENAIRRGYQALISVTDFSVDRLNDAIKYMIGMRIDGILIMTSEMDDKVLKIVQERKIPAVFEDVGTVNATTSNLRIDYEGGIYRAVRCLVELGHERILFVQNPPMSLQPEQMFSHRVRAEAFQAAVDRFPNLIAHKFAGSGRSPFQAGVDCARQILQRFDITGVVASADPHAVGILRGFQRAGKRVPGDISIIGFDNSILCEYTDPQLASVNISRREIAESAVETLLGMIEQNHPGVEIHIPTELVMRESVGRPRSS
jgi:LacI family transcriptional regulator